jgi:2-deoxy-D-gluconate 3-dehydrogenase
VGRDAFSVEGHVALVTGGAMGIGFGIARRFVESGADVLIADVDEAAAGRAIRALGDGPGKVAACLVDVGAEDAPGRMVGACVHQFGGLDVLVNNAGVFPQVPMLDMTTEAFDRVYRINLRGLAFAAKAAAIQMVQSGRGGAIINIGSVDSLHPSMVGLAAYDASKGGVLMFTRSLALELAPHRIRVNAILPGAVQTEGTSRSRPLAGSGMNEEQFKTFMAQFVKQRVPLGRIGMPDDIAKVAQFLASSAADFLTGSAVVVDGGMLLT